MKNCEICKNCKHFIQYYTLLGVRLHESGRGHCGQKRSKAVWSDTKKACEKFDLRDEQAWCGEKLERVLEAARLAPSACNAQPWRFVVITDKELAQKAGKAAAGLGMNKFAKDAPVHILVVEESANITSLLGGKVKGKHFPLIDIGIAAAHISLAAEAEGLGSCILGWFDEKELKQLAGIPASKRLLLDIVIGYPAKEKRKKIRKPKEKVISYNRY